MRKVKLWIIPAAFFAVCVVLNLAGCLTEGQLERMIKPALMPLLALSALAIGVNGVMLLPMGVYGFVLTMLIFSGLSGVLRIGGASWIIILCGALLFTFSDSLIAVRNFGSLSPFMGGFVVMATYLAAQVLLAVGGVRLILRK